MPDLWDPIAGDYRTSDGWIRLHTNKPAHRNAAISALQCESTREAVTAIVEKAAGQDLEKAVIDAGGCAAVMHSEDQWRSHPQGRAVASEPLVAWSVRHSLGNSRNRLPPSRLKSRPLAGVKVLDLTRVLAGPVCTRFLSAFGAQVLRLDEPDWNEDFPTIEMSVGKRRAGLDLGSEMGRLRFLELLADADVFVHGLRSDALEKLGLGQSVRDSANPSVIDVALCAYGWSGPWAARRGFDSLVQMSCGIAHTGMLKSESASRPVPLPCQALDHGTGYLMAAAVLDALSRRELDGEVSSARLSLARTAELLKQFPATESTSRVIAETSPSDYMSTPEATEWGAIRRLRFPCTIQGLENSWSIPAGELRVHSADWSDTTG